MAHVDGRVEPGFEPVAQQFRQNFDQHDELGAAVAVYSGGRLVADLWGGIADEQTGRAWDADTLALVFSTTKGMTATCANLLVERGELDLDAPVTDYWPEFGQEGKGAVPVRWLLCHKPGLVTVDRQLTLEQGCSWDPVVAALAAQKPFWEPGTAHGYHALTFGWLVGEVVRRVSGRSLGSFFADEIAGPLELQTWIGLPESEEHRVARLVTLPMLGGTDAPPPATMPNAEALQLMGRALTLNGTFAGDVWNTRAVHAAQIGAAAGIGTARSIAKMYASLIGEVDGVRLLKPETVDAARSIESQGPDRVLIVETRFGLGYMLHAPFTPFGGPRSFGHPGAGGSVGWADPEAGLAIAYVMNKMQMNLSGDPRMTGLIDAAYRSLAA